MIGCTVQQLCNAVGGTLLQESGAVVTEEIGRASCRERV